MGDPDVVDVEALDTEEDYYIIIIIIIISSSSSSTTTTTTTTSIIPPRAAEDPRVGPERARCPADSLQPFHFTDYSSRRTLDL